MIFIWLLVGPVIDILESFVKPIAIIIAVIAVDHMLQLGLTNFVIELIESWLVNYFKSNWGNFA